MKQSNLESPARKSATTAAWLSVVRVYNLCDAAMTARLAELGLRVGEHEVLANLMRSPGVTQQTLANAALWPKVVSACCSRAWRHKR